MTRVKGLKDPKTRPTWLIARLAHHYFTRDSNHEIVAFAVDGEYRQADQFLGLPLVDVADVPRVYPPDRFDMFVALSYTRMNQVRAAKYEQVRELGYRLVSYVSSRCTFLTDQPIGDNCFILEDNTVQPFVRIGRNVVMWSGNHVGHHARIGDNCFISSHVVISGSVDVGENSFLGVNSTLVNDISVGRDCWIGPSVTLTRNAEPGCFYTPAKSTLRDESALERFLS